MDHDNGYYIFIDGDNFMIFDLSDDSGWIGKVPIDEDDQIIDNYLKEILTDEED